VLRALLMTYRQGAGLCSGNCSGSKQSSSILFRLPVHRTIEILQTLESALHRFVRGMNVLWLTVIVLCPATLDGVSQRVKDEVTGHL